MPSKGYVTLRRLAQRGLEGRTADDAAACGRPANCFTSSDRRSRPQALGQLPVGTLGLAYVAARIVITHRQVFYLRTDTDYWK